MNLYILCDPAGGEELQKRKKKLSDRTTMMVIGLAPDNNYYWLDGICDRLNPTERVDTLFDLHRKWNELTGKPPVVGYEHYSIQTDTHYIRKKQEETGYRFNIVELGGGMSKNERIRRMIPDMQRGRWWFPYDMTRIDYMGRSIDLVREMVKSEMPTFPKARHDDMLDAMTRIYDEEIDAVFPRLKQKKTHSAYSNYDAGQDWISA
jgi:predicted phage terminase large subunit-like protein